MLLLLCHSPLANTQLLFRARQEYNAIQEGHHKAVDALRKKHAESCGQLEEKVDELQKAKQKLESEKKQLSQQNLELGGDVESLTRAKVSIYCTQK